MGDVEEKGAAGLLDVDCVLAGEAKADEVFRTEDVGDAGEDLRLVLLHPEQLGEGEVGQRGIGDERDEPVEADALGEQIALRLGALVAPDHRRAKYLAGRVEQYAAVHLAGQTDCFDLVFGACFAQDGGDRQAGGVPPVFGILLCPASVLGVNWLVLCRGGEDDRSGI